MPLNSHQCHNRNKEEHEAYKNWLKATNYGKNTMLRIRKVVKRMEHLIAATNGGDEKKALEAFDLGVHPNTGKQNSWVSWADAQKADGNNNTPGASKKRKGM